MGEGPLNNLKQSMVQFQKPQKLYGDRHSYISRFDARYMLGGYPRGYGRSMPLPHQYGRVPAYGGPGMVPPGGRGYGYMASQFPDPHSQDAYNARVYSGYTQSSQPVSQSSMYSQGMAPSHLTQSSQPMTASLSQDSTFVDDFKSQESFQDRSQDYSSSQFSQGSQYSFSHK